MSTVKNLASKDLTTSTDPPGQAAKTGTNFFELEANVRVKFVLSVISPIRRLKSWIVSALTHEAD